MNLCSVWNINQKFSGQKYYETRLFSFSIEKNDISPELYQNSYLGGLVIRKNIWLSHDRPFDKLYRKLFLCTWTLKKSWDIQGKANKFNVTMRLNGFVFILVMISLHKQATLISIDAIFFQWIITCLCKTRLLLGNMYYIFYNNHSFIFSKHKSTLHKHNCT